MCVGGGSTWGVVFASEKNCKIGHRLVSVGVSVGMVQEFPQTIFLVLFKRKASWGSCLQLCSHSFLQKNKRSAADYCGNLLGSKGIGAGSSPIGCEGFWRQAKFKAALYYFQLLIILSDIYSFGFCNLSLEVTVKKWNNALINWIVKDFAFRYLLPGLQVNPGYHTPFSGWQIPSLVTSRDLEIATSGTSSMAVACGLSHGVFFLFFWFDDFRFKKWWCWSTLK